MSRLGQQLIDYLRTNNYYDVYFSAPVEEIDPIYDDDGNLWANWRHTGEVTFWLKKRGERTKRYHAYCKHRLFDALETVFNEMAQDFGITL